VSHSPAQALAAATPEPQTQLVSNPAPPASIRAARRRLLVVFVGVAVLVQQALSLVWPEHGDAGMTGKARAKSPGRRARSPAPRANKIEKGQDNLAGKDQNWLCEKGESRRGGSSPRGRGLALARAPQTSAGGEPAGGAPAPAKFGHRRLMSFIGGGDNESGAEPEV